MISDTIPAVINPVVINPVVINPIDINPVVINRDGTLEECRVLSCIYTCINIYNISCIKEEERGL
jgi:hypothetical protein